MRADPSQTGQTHKRPPQKDIHPSLPTLAINPLRWNATKVQALSSLQPTRTVRNVNVGQKQMTEVSPGTEGICLQRKNRGRYSKT